MKTYTTDELNDIFETLPKALQSAISSVDTANKIEEIRKKHSLHIDQAGKLGSEVGYVLLGITPIKDFVKSVEEEVGVDKQKANDVADDVNSLIFEGVREYLKIATSKPEVLGPVESKSEILREIENEEEERELPQELPAENVNLNREEILKEIEDDTGIPETKIKAETNSEGDKNFLSGNIEKSVESRPEIPEKPVDENNIPTETKRGREIFEDKLAEPVSLGREEKESSIETKKEVYKKGVDPYREIIE